MSTPRKWTTIREYEDILFDYYNGIARITINRERYRNAFTPTTTAEMSDALRICREEADIDVIVITGAGDKAFCSGGDQNVKGRGGYIGKDGIPRLSVLDVQKQIRSIPKPVIAAVNGFAIGGGHVLHVVCDLSIASENAIFEQPIRAGQWEEMARLTSESPLPIALDEELIGCNTLEGKQKLLSAIRPQYIILKPSLHGGVCGGNEWISEAEKRQIGWWITSALESNIGLNAIAQWCATFDNPLPQGLGTGLLFTDNVEMPLEIRKDCLWFCNDAI